MTIGRSMSAYDNSNTCYCRLGVFTRTVRHLEAVSVNLPPFASNLFPSSARKVCPKWRDGGGGALYLWRAI
jgi:hypothetical protein